LESGAAERIVRSLIQLFGERKAPAAFMLSSFILAIPTFFEAVFYLMVPMARIMGARRPKIFPVLIMAIVGGSAMAGGLVPPAPGPLFVTGVLGINIGLMIRRFSYRHCLFECRLAVCLLVEPAPGHSLKNNSRYYG